MTQAIWTPGKARVNNSEVRRFDAFLNDRARTDLQTGNDLRIWSLAHSKDYWSAP